MSAEIEIYMKYINAWDGSEISDDAMKIKVLKIQ